MPGSGNKDNFDDVLASLILSTHAPGCFTTVNIRKRMLYRHCYISFLQAQAVPNNLDSIICRTHEAYNETTLDRQQSKTSILSTNVDQK